MPGSDASSPVHVACARAHSHQRFLRQLSQQHDRLTSTIGLFAIGAKTSTESPTDTYTTVTAQQPHNTHERMIQRQPLRHLSLSCSHLLPGIHAASRRTARHKIRSPADPTQYRSHGNAHLLVTATGALAAHCADAQVLQEARHRSLALHRRLSLVRQLNDNAVSVIALMDAHGYFIQSNPGILFWHSVYRLASTERQTVNLIST